jgi:3-oxoadipate enol-lactonase
VLTELGDTVPAIAIDRPGYDGVSEPGGIAHSAQAALRRLDSDGIERATIVGFSYGGAVAAWLGADHPERVKALILVSAAANTAALKPIDQVLAAPLIGPVISAVLVAGAQVVVRSPPLLGRAARRAFLVEQREMLRELPILEQKLSAIEAPTIVVIGTADTVVPPQAGRLLATQIPRAELVEIERAGHTLPSTHAVRISELIRNSRAVSVT